MATPTSECRAIRLFRYADVSGIFESIVAISELPLLLS
jgi:hypothetical protein